MCSNLIGLRQKHKIKNRTPLFAVVMVNALLTFVYSHATFIWCKKETPKLCTYDNGNLILLCDSFNQSHPEQNPAAEFAASVQDVTTAL